VQLPKRRHFLEEIIITKTENNISIIDQSEYRAIRYILEQLRRKYVLLFLNLLKITSPFLTNQNTELLDIF